MILLIFRWYVLFLLFFFWCHLGVVLWYGNNILCNILRVFGVYFVVTFWVNMLANNTVYCIITICFLLLLLLLLLLLFQDSWQLLGLMSACKRNRGQHEEGLLNFSSCHDSGIHLHRHLRGCHRPFLL